MSVNFSNLLNVQASAVERPKPLPVGTYDGVVLKHDFNESKEQKTPYCRLTIRLVAPGADVDQEALTSYGGQAALQKVELNTDFWLTEKSMFRFRELFEKVLKMDITGKTLDELAATALDNQSVKVEIKHDIDKKDNQVIYANIARLLPA